MKMKTLFALAMTLTATGAFANSMELPKGLIEKHVAACPDFLERELYTDIQTLPSTDASKQNTLYVMGCEMYAYNSLEKAYIVNEAGLITDVVVADIGVDGIRVTSDLMGAGYDAATQTLGTFQKGRGMADCGSSSTYKFDAYDAKFVLIEARLKDNCDGEETEWPVVYKK